MLNIAIFNMINSYSNQKDTICNNINYLKYFYHLFPIHVQKFYWFFHRYVNTKIEELITSIESLDDQKSSIDCQIKGLKNTEKMIEELSTQITSNVTQLNETITKHNRFDSLVWTIKQELGTSICDLKDLDKIKQIDKILCKIVEQIKKEDSEMLQSIKGQLEKHEKDLKRKLTKYIDITKDGLRSVKTRIENLETKILCYIKVGGEFQSLEIQLKAYYQKVDYVYIKRKKYLVIGSSILIEEDKDVENKLKEVNKQSNEYGKKIEETKKELIKLHRKLCCEGNVRFVIGDFEKDGEHYNRILSDIPDFVNRLKMFENFANGICVTKGPMKGLIEITTIIESAKSIVDRKKKDLDELLPHLLRDTLVIETKDIYGLINDMTNLRISISNSIKRLNNTKFLFEYLSKFMKQKEKLCQISFPRNGLSGIDQLVKTMRQFKREYQAAVKHIIGHGSILLSKFEWGEYHSDLREGRSKYMPKTMKLDRRPLVKLEGHIKNLEAIKTFNNSLTEITPRMSKLNGNSRQYNGSDVNGTLSWLGTIDGTLSTVYNSTNSAISKMKKTYEGNKENINGTTSGNGSEIQKLVESIGQIPDKIAELKSIVRWSIVLLNIAKSVNETLNVKENTWKLDKIGGSLRDIQH